MEEVRSGPEALVGREHPRVTRCAEASRPSRRDRARARRTPRARARAPSACSPSPSRRLSSLSRTRTTLSPRARRRCARSSPNPAVSRNRSQVEPGRARAPDPHGCCFHRGGGSPQTGDRSGAVPWRETRPGLRVRPGSISAAGAGRGRSGARHGRGARRATGIPCRAGRRRPASTERRQEVRQVGPLSSGCRRLGITPRTPAASGCCRTREESVFPGRPRGSTRAGSASGVRMPSAKRTVLRRCSAQYSGRTACSGVIHVPVQFETNGMRGGWQADADAAGTPGSAEGSARRGASARRS